MASDLFARYFPELSPAQVAQLEALSQIYAYWNERVNLISRKDMAHFATRHVLHSLFISKVWKAPKGAKAIDLGTGGGFPGIPLAIAMPQVQWTLVDSIQKKIQVVKTVAEQLGLENVSTHWGRIEDFKQRCDMVVSRAVAEAPQLVQWSQALLSKPGPLGNLEKGWLLLKGGDLSRELDQVRLPKKSYDLKDSFEDPFFETKKLIHLVHRT